MKILVAIITVFNALLGGAAALNAVGIWQDSKYAPATNWMAAILFLGLAAFGASALFGRASTRLAVLLGLAPWVLGLVAVILALLLSNPH